MRYKALSLKELQAFAIELEKSYQPTKYGMFTGYLITNQSPQRLAFLKLYTEIIKLTSALPAREATDILMGLPIFEEQWILEKEGSGEKKEGYFYTNGSGMLSLIREKIIQPNNLLQDDQRLIYLLKFFKCVKDNLPDEFFKNSYWKKKENLVNEIHEMLKKVKEKDFERFRSLAEGPPRLIALQKNISTAEGEYLDKTKSRWFTNADRYSALEFNVLIDETLHELLPKIENEPGANNNFAKDFNYLKECNIRQGLILLSLMQISSEKKYKYLLSAQRSVLFQQYLSYLNVKELDEISKERKIDLLRAISLHLTNIKEDKKYYNELKVKCQNKEHNLDKEFTYYLKLIDQFLVDLELEMSSPSYMSTALSYATQYLISFTASQFLKNVGLASVGGAVVSTLSGPVGMVVFGTAGIILTQLGRLVSDKIIPQAVSYVYASVLEKIGAAIGDAAVGAVTYTFSLTSQGFQQLLKHPKLKEEDREFIGEWINTLLELPDDIMSKEEKNQIRKNVLGIDDFVKEDTIKLTGCMK